MLAIADFVAGALKPIADLIDAIHTSDDERNKARAALAAVQVDFLSKVLDYEARVNEARSAVLMAEAQGNSWLQRSWRPLTMLTFLVLVVGDSFGVLANRLAPEAWTLLQLGLGGYVVGRSAEKVAPILAESLGRRN